MINWNRVKKTVKEGGIIIFPTETCYGLGCDAFNEEAVKKIYRTKKRPKGKPLLVIISDFKMWRKIAIPNKEAEEYAKKVWPGPVTIVQRKRGIVPTAVAKGRIGCRISSNKIATRIAKECRVPVVATSANVGGGRNPYSIKEIPVRIKNSADYIIDAGALPGKKPSKVVDIKNGKIKELRK